MAWARIDDSYPTDPRTLAAGPEAAYLNVAGLCYCNRLLTDGFIPNSMLTSLVPGLKWVKKRAATLVKVGLWDQVPDGYMIRDFLATNYSKAQIESERAKKQQAGQKGAAARWRTIAPAMAPAIAPAMAPRNAPIPSHKRQKQVLPNLDTENQEGRSRSLDPNSNGNLASSETARTKPPRGLYQEILANIKRLDPTLPDDVAGERALKDFEEATRRQ